jgi:hypothetical protein
MWWNLGQTVLRVCRNELVEKEESDQVVEKTRGKGGDVKMAEGQKGSGPLRQTLQQDQYFRITMFITFPSTPAALNDLVCHFDELFALL